MPRRQRAAGARHRHRPIRARLGAGRADRRATPSGRRVSSARNGCSSTRSSRCSARSASSASPRRKRSRRCSTESGAAQAEVTDQLGDQVRRAVELLVDAFSRADRRPEGDFSATVAPAEVYNAAVTVMMRLVFLLAAEERRLLPADDPLYSASYSVLTTREQLERDADPRRRRDAREAHTAWHRLLATFRAVHGGIEHDRLRLPAYGGSLFDPDRYPVPGLRRRFPSTTARRCAVLDALQVLSFRQGGVTEARRLSYPNLDVEQIGHVYEGLLDHAARGWTTVALGLDRHQGRGARDRARASSSASCRKGEDSFAEWLAEKGGPQASRVKKLLFDDLEPDRRPSAARRLRQRRGDLRARAAVRRAAPRRPARPAGGLHARVALRHPDLAAARLRHGVHDEGAGRGGRAVRARAARLLARPGRGREPPNWKLKPSAELLRPEGLRPRGRLRRDPRRRLPLPRRPAGRGVEGRSATAGSPPAILEGVPEQRVDARRPPARSPTTACTASTGTRWRSRWPSCRCG